MRLLQLVVVAVLLALPATAGASAFAGTLEMQLSAEKAGGGGTLKILVGDAGVLSEMQLRAGALGQVSVRYLVKKRVPDIVWIIDDASKTYREVSTKVPGTTQAVDDDAWNMKKIGTETISGYACVHVVGTSSTGARLEMWTTKELMDGGQFTRAIGKEAKVSDGLMKALAQQGADGFPAKIIRSAKDGSTTSMQLVKVTKTPPPASTFELPAGYTKGEGTGAVPPAVQKQLDEAMKGLTAEQREQMKKMMQGQPR